jgi:phosphoribosylcarboxyaminoimidazole (NCAIR) mutase
VQILAAADPALAERLQQEREKNARTIQEKDRALNN